MTGSKSQKLHKCVSCSNEAVPGKSRCRLCLDRSRAATKTYRDRHPNRVAISQKKTNEKYKHLGLCRCGKPSQSGKTTCLDCKKKHDHKQLQRRNARVKAGLCLACGSVTKGMIHCRECLDKIRVRVGTLKAEVVSAYGGKCNCCGEDEFLFLQIDHVNGGGKKDRDAGLFSTTWYRWLKANNYPKEYQLLCANCNWGKHLNGGVCPHQDRR
jgi:hypothetical protein